MKTSMNVPLTQGATATGRAPRSEEQVSLWVLTFMVREAVLVAPDNMEKKEAMYYFNGVYQHLKSVWVRIRDALSGMTEGVPYILSSFAYLRVPQDRDVSGCWKKEDFLQAFYLNQTYMEFYDHQPTFCDDLEWPNPADAQPFWCKLIVDLNAARAARDEPALVLSLESPLFSTHPRFPLFSTLFQSHYRPLTATSSSKTKRPRTSTDSDYDAALASGTSTKISPSGSASSSKPSATAAKLPGPSNPTKPKLKRPRHDLEPEDVEMADEASESSPPPTVPQPAPGRKGKGREVIAGPEEAFVELEDIQALVSQFANQDIMFEAALKEQLSACAQGGHDCFVALKHFHGCWRCKTGSNGCSLAPKAEYSAKGELKNMRGQSHWPWYITLVFHVLNVLALDTEKGPQHLPADYTGIQIPPFPSKKPNSVLKPLTTKRVSDLAVAKKAMKAPVYYALPRALYKDLEAQRSESPKWPMLPKDARTRFENILSRAENGSIKQPWMTSASEDEPERGRSRSRAPNTAEKARPQPRPRTRASSKASEKNISPSEPVTGGHRTSVPPSVPSTSRARALSQVSSIPRTGKRGPSKPRSTSQKAKKTPIQRWEIPRAVRGKSIKIKKEDAVIKGRSGVRRAYVGKRPPRVMRRVPSHTDEDEGLYTLRLGRRLLTNLPTVTLKAIEGMEVEPQEVFLTEPINTVFDIPAPGPSRLTSSRAEDPHSHDVPVTMERLSVALLSQRAEILEGITESLADERGAINSQIQSGLYSLTEASLATLAGKWLQSGETAAKAVFDGMSQGVTDIVDQKLSIFLQNVEAHLDEKINRSVQDLKDYLEVKLDSRFPSNVTDVHQSPEDDRSTDNADENEDIKKEVNGGPGDENTVVTPHRGMSESRDVSREGPQTSANVSEQGRLRILPEALGRLHDILNDYASSPTSSTEHPEVLSRGDTGSVEGDADPARQPSLPDDISSTLPQNEVNVVDSGAETGAALETDTDGESSEDETADMDVDPDADGDAESEEDELEEGEIGEADDKGSNSEEKMEED
ncbi:hypothetical protein QCA50_020047 [Cerrena zonata]|uniref:Uncharacterized protein n=1 Tax=Cerrena zonata TaxID=2478898 RepID=A0AAW0F8L7_9APHY